MVHKQQGPQAEQKQQPAKKPYQKPAFRCEHVFETAALACGKTTTAQCGPTLKRS